MESDIVARLRAVLHNDRSVELMNREAADEIERMRDERDEARRMYCEAVILHGTAHRFDANGVPEEITDAKEFARMLRWDCFPEVTP